MGGKRFKALTNRQDFQIRLCCRHKAKVFLAAYRCSVVARLTYTSAGGKWVLQLWAEGPVVMMVVIQRAFTFSPFLLGRVRNVALHLIPAGNA